MHYSFLILLFALFVAPRVLQRFRIPTAITSFAMGAICALQLGYLPNDFQGDVTIKFLATLGIVSLFLFAGLDVEFRELRHNSTILLQHLAIQVVSLALLAAALVWWLDLSIRPSTLIALALLTPSTGFILDALDGFNLPEKARFWIKSKAIATELVALAVLFVALQSSSAQGLGLSSLILVGMIGFLPFLFRLFAKLILPYAPKSEFAFLMMVAVACGVITYELGVYYLVGAFVVGMAAQRLRLHLPAMASEKMLSSVEAFSSLFVPFYFFNAGLNLRQADFSLAALGVGLSFAVCGISFRLIPIWLHRRVVFGEGLRESMLVGMPMLPTLVFTLVIAGILREKFQIGSTLFGGLVVYAILNSLIPGLVFRTRVPEEEDALLVEESPHNPT
ncbi:MAG: cation:proton antiporter [Planctomycetes bacterium]|nr:cation:proton antiporter [Planctomycetota bacterium]